MFGHKPYSCPFSKSECDFDKMLAHEKVDWTYLIDDEDSEECWKPSVDERKSTLIDTTLQLILLDDLNSDVKNGCRRHDDLKEVENLLKE